MKLAIGFWLLALSSSSFALSSSSFAEGFIVGPRFGHQNLKAHSKGTSYSDFNMVMGNKGPIVITPYNDETDESSQAFFNTTIEGLRLGYETDSLVLFSDWDFARYYTPGTQLDLFSLGLGVQFSILQTESFKFYTQLGMSSRSMRFRLYETKYDIDFGSRAVSGETFVDTLNTINYDLGLGMAMPLMEKMSLAFEARYSDTLSKGTFDVKTSQRYSNETDSVEYESHSKSKNNTFTVQELTVGLLFSL